MLCSDCLEECDGARRHTALFAARSSGAATTVCNATLRSASVTAPTARVLSLSRLSRSTARMSFFVFCLTIERALLPTHPDWLGLLAFGLSVACVSPVALCVSHVALCLVHKANGLGRPALVCFAAGTWSSQVTTHTPRRSILSLLSPHRQRWYRASCWSSSTAG